MASKIDNSNHEVLKIFPTQQTFNVIVDMAICCTFVNNEK